MTAPQTGKGTVLIVDDDASVRAGLSRLARCAGYAVQTFASADGFSVDALTEGTACLVVDVRMRGRGGLALAEQLRRSGNPIPAILISADDGEDIRKQAIALGAAGFFHKPVDGRALLDAIEWALTARSSRAQPDARGQTVTA